MNTGETWSSVVFALPMAYRQTSAAVSCTQDTRGESDVELLTATTRNYSE